MATQTDSRLSIHTETQTAATVERMIETDRDVQRRVVSYWPAKVAEFEDGRLWVHQEVLGLDVSVTHALGMDISQTAEQLVHVHLREDRECWHDVRQCLTTYMKPFGYFQKKSKRTFEDMLVHYRYVFPVFSCLVNTSQLRWKTSGNNIAQYYHISQCFIAAHKLFLIK